MKYKDIKGLKNDELVKKKQELEEELFHSTMKNSLGQLGNVISIRKIRRDIARVMTALNEKK